MLTMDFKRPPFGLWPVLYHVWPSRTSSGSGCHSFCSKLGGINVKSFQTTVCWDIPKTQSIILHGLTNMPSCLAWQTRCQLCLPGDCVMNVITLPASACLLWMVHVIYRREPKAIRQLCVQMCLCVHECACVLRLCGWCGFYLSICGSAEDRAVKAPYT